MDKWWIMICSINILNLIKNDKTILEKDILEKVSSLGLLYAFKHDHYWQSMDTMRDHEILDNLSKKRIAMVILKIYLSIPNSFQKIYFYF